MNNENISNNVTISNTKNYREDITQEAFDNAIHTLTLNNKSITIRAIREIIGGSNEKIGSFLRDYNKKAMMSKFKSSMPDSYQEKIMALSSELYNFFESKCSTDRIELQNEYDRRHKEILELMKANDDKVNRAEAEVKKLSEELTSKDNRIKELETQLKQSQELNFKLNQEVKDIMNFNQQKILEAISNITPSTSK